MIHIARIAINSIKLTFSTPKYYDRHPCKDAWACKMDKNFRFYGHFKLLRDKKPV